VAALYRSRGLVSGGEELVLAVDVGGGQRGVGGRAPGFEQAVFQKQVFGGGAIGVHVA
jgi:hypothetical protein